MGRYELYIYRMIGMLLTYTLPYLLRPKRILRTIKSFFREDSSTVAEQRLKDHLRRSTLFTKYLKPLILRIFTSKDKNRIIN
jgi:membrane protein DedA with SNARE-associated domain